MAKLVQKKKRKMKFIVKAFIIFTIALLSQLFVNIYIGSTNTSLVIDIQKAKNEISTLRAENQQLNIEIQTLQNKDRVYTIANDAGLTRNQENVISIASVTNVQD